MIPKVAAILLVPLTTTANAHTAGSLDPTFHPGASIDYADGPLLILPDGRLIVARRELSHSGDSWKPIRLFPDGRPDPEFQAEPLSRGGSDFGPIGDVALESDGSLLVARPYALLRLRPDGSRDVGFEPSFTNGGLHHEPRILRAVRALPDGRILTAGGFTHANGERRPGIARLQRDGSLDPTFAADEELAAGRDPIIKALELLADGSVVVIQGQPGFTNDAPSALRVLGSDGAIDRAFAPGAEIRHVQSLRVEADGTILVAGNLQMPGGLQFGFARLDRQGRLRSSFVASRVPWTEDAQWTDDSPYTWRKPGPPNGDVCPRWAVQPDGKIIAVGVDLPGSELPIDEPKRLILRFERDGSPDPTFVQGSTEVRLEQFRSARVALQADGRIVLVGRFTSVHGRRRYSIARLNPDGSLDPALNHSSGIAPASGWGAVSGLFTMTDGKVLVSSRPFFGEGIGSGFDPAPLGDMDLIDSDSGDPVMFGRLNPDGSWDSTLDASRIVGNWIVPQSDGRLLLAANGGIRRLSSDGTPDLTFDTSSWSSPSTHLAPAILLPDQRILVTGVRGGRRGVWRLRSEGSLDTEFDFSFPAEGAGARGFITALATAPDGSVYVGGLWDRRVIRLASNGREDPGFVWTGRTGQILALLVREDGRLLVGGAFISLGETSSAPLVQVLDDGSEDPSFRARITAISRGGQPQVQGMVRQADGSLIVRGLFSEVDGASRLGLARLLPNGRLDAALVVGTIMGDIAAVAVQSDGRVLVGGRFHAIDGNPIEGVARLLGQEAVSFLPGFPRRLAGGRLELRARAKPGRTVVLESVSTLNEGRWMTAGSGQATDGEVSFEVPQSTDGPGAFYRVVVP